MKPVPMPEGLWTDCRRVTIGGEFGTTPAEYAIDLANTNTPIFITLVEFSPEELAAIAKSGQVVLTLHGAEVPWEVRPLDPDCPHTCWHVPTAIEDLTEEVWTVICDLCGKSGLPHPEDPEEAV